MREGEKPLAEDRACAMAQMSEKTCPLRKSQYFGMPKGDRARDETGKAMEAQLTASFLSQTWILNITVNLVEAIET